MKYACVDGEGKVICVLNNRQGFKDLIECPDDIIFGDVNINSEFHRIAPRPEPQPIEPVLPSMEDRMEAMEAAILTLMEVIG